jgi:hypothetical protein
MQVLAANTKFMVSIEHTGARHDEMGFDISNLTGYLKKPHGVS